MKKLSLCLVIASLGAFMFQTASATPAFAQKEDKLCSYCHLKPAGGGATGFRGMYYAKHKNSFKAFVEAVQAKKAGVKVNAMAAATKPTKKYTGK